ncbi:MAG TPA: hypothetical protein VNS88_07240 [Nitrospiraceae bacterium]|nr:hypothetical protein [Nitrospiraceae bacterium]
MPGYVKSEDREVTDLEMMEHPDWWPNLVLPLKQGNRAAILTATMDNQSYRLVEDANMFDGRWTERPSIPLDKSELQTVIDRGWKVD